MKKTCMIAVLALATITAGAQEWEQLFNGKNLKGWERLNGEAEYEVVDGTIVGYSKTRTPNSFLATKKTYSDFILEFEFRMDDMLNSGVQFRSLSNKEYRDYRVHGYQFEMDPSDRAWSAGIFDEARNGWLYTLGDNPEARKAFKSGTWNKARIEACGSSIRTFLNGIPCANLLDNTTAEGFIALQVHGISNDKSREGKTVEWRNIRICTKDVEKYLTPADRCAVEKNNISNTISAKEAAEGWTLLWDGKTTEGWRGAKLDHFPEKGWTIENGILSVNASDGSESTNGGDIVTVRKYRNFILKVDFSITAGANSGIKYFVDTELNKGKGSAIGCEFQILDNAKHPDAKLGVNGNRKVGSLYDLIPAKGGEPVRAGLFYTAMIVVQGNHVEHYLDGVKVVEYERGNQMWDALVDYSKYRDWPNFGNAQEGHILLQDHGDNVRFRNIKIKELD